MARRGAVAPRVCHHTNRQVVCTEVSAPMTARLNTLGYKVALTDGVCLQIDLVFPKIPCSQNGSHVTILCFLALAAKADSFDSVWQWLDGLCIGLGPHCADVDDLASAGLDDGKKVPPIKHALAHAGGGWAGGQADAHCDSPMQCVCGPVSREVDGLDSWVAWAWGCRTRSMSSAA